VSPEPQASRNDAVRESVESCPAEALFDARRRAVLAVLGFASDEPTVTGGNGHEGGVAALFLRLVDLPDAVVLEILTIVMGETLASGSAVVAALGVHLGVNMADWWEADAAFFDLIRDREALLRIVAEVAGETVAAANSAEKTKVLKRIIRDHLDGAEGRRKVERWVPRWLGFPASAYASRGGNDALGARDTAESAQVREPDSDPATAPLQQAA
jgi:ParB family chromosome partitioning protein